MDIFSIPDDELQKIIHQGGDVHRAVAARALGKDPDDVTDAERTTAKKGVFARLYGAKPKANAR